MEVCYRNIYLDRRPRWRWGLLVERNGKDYYFAFILPFMLRGFGFKKV